MAKRVGLTNLAEVGTIPDMGTDDFPVRSEHNRRLREQAHKRLQALLNDAESHRLHGVVGIEAMFEDGKIVTVRRQIRGTDR